MLWPASADLSDLHPIVKYTFPADIMQVAFADEIWIYQLHEDGEVRKVVNKRIDARHKEEEPAKRISSV
jgi:archaeosine-15-forming tRNA-guanine transglycosylase